MELRAKPMFKRAYKKFNDKQRRIIDEEIREIMQAPESKGRKKKGDLDDIYVDKFRMDDQIYLLAYAFDPKTLVLYYLGIHENYYRDLKRYLN